MIKRKVDFSNKNLTALELNAIDRLKINGKRFADYEPSIDGVFLNWAGNFVGGVGIGAMRVASNGAVGINTDTPLRAFHVVGSSSQVMLESTNNHKVGLWSNGNDATFQISTWSSTESALGNAFTIFQNSRNISIGSTTDTGNRFYVLGNARVDGNITMSGDVSFASAKYFASTGNIAIGSTVDSGAKLYVNAQGSIVRFSNLSSQGGSLRFTGAGSIGTSIEFNEGKFLIQNVGGLNEVVNYNVYSALGYHSFQFAGTEYARINTTGIRSAKEFHASSNQNGSTGLFLYRDGASVNQAGSVFSYGIVFQDLTATTNKHRISLRAAGYDVLNIDSSLSVAVGALTADNSAVFDITSTTKGMLIPRMTSVQRNAITSPATGLIVYQTDAPEGIYTRKSTGWVQVV